MTNDEYTLTDALKYVERMQNINDYSMIDISKFNESIKLFADKGDKENFKKLTDKFLYLVKNSSATQDVKENPLSFLEFICGGMDNGFTNFVQLQRGLQEGFKPGNAQKMLIEAYNLKKDSGDYLG